MKDQFDTVVAEVKQLTSAWGDYLTRELFYTIRNPAYLDTKDMEISSAILQVAYPGVEERGLLHNITKIGCAARLRYLSEADGRKLAMSAASILYTAAIVLIAVITMDQTMAVLTAAGWGWLWKFW